MKNEKEEKERYCLPCEDDYGKPSCYMCKLCFRSMKSLYKHMNAHSISDWRDILPPDPKKSTVDVCRRLLPTFDPVDDIKFNDDEEKGLQKVDLIMFLPQWRVTTGRRGCPGIGVCKQTSSF